MANLLGYQNNIITCYDCAFITDELPICLAYWWLFRTTDGIRIRLLSGRCLGWSCPRTTVDSLSIWVSRVSRIPDQMVWAKLTVLVHGLRGTWCRSDYWNPEQSKCSIQCPTIHHHCRNMDGRRVHRSGARTQFGIKSRNQIRPSTSQTRCHRERCRSLLNSLRCLMHSTPYSAVVRPDCAPDRCSSASAPAPRCLTAPAGPEGWQDKTPTDKQEQ